MWQSQDDIIKDLASLNDFGDPEDKEPYKALYSIGRGLKFKEKNKISEKFIDSRTGEEIDAADEILDGDYCYKGKGRGSLLGVFSRSKFQLQQQLRLARPLGSGDEAIESYCRRNRQVKDSSSTVTILDSDLESGSREITSRNINHNLNLDRTKHRIKAVRHSSTHSNALINGLLSGRNTNSEAQLNCKAGNFFGNHERKDVDNLDINCDDVIVNSSDSDSTVETGCNEFSTEGSPSVIDEFLKGECRGKTACLKGTVGSHNKPLSLSRAASSVSVEIPNYFEEEKEQRYEEITDIKDIQNCLENNFYDSTKTHQERNEKYRLLGERLNRLRRIDPKASGIYEFSEISRFIASVDTESDKNSTTVIAANPVPASFVVNDEEFPPLHNGRLRP